MSSAKFTVILALFCSVRMKFFSKFVSIVRHASTALRKRILFLLLSLVIFNVSVWICAFIISAQHPVFLGLVVLAYGLGLRHAVDADHIAAIDNTTRKLMQEKQKPVAVGFFFSLGHSTVVILLSLLVAFSTSFVKTNLPAFKETGSIIGTSISSIFLLGVGIINLLVLIDIIKVWKKIVKGEKYTEEALDEHLTNRGFLARLLKPVLKTVKKSWHMYPVGFLFGLGFDTASEIGLLSISAATGASGLPIFAIIILPLAFTAGMSLIDTLDSVLMLGAYGWAYVKPIRKLYYNMHITFLSVFIALFIGSIEALQIITKKLQLKGPFFYFIQELDFGNLGYIIIGAFLASWIISLLLYRIKKYDLLERR